MTPNVSIGRASRAAMSRALWIAAPFAALVFVWQLSAIALDLPTTLYPTPASSWAALIDLIRRGVIGAYFADSALRYAGGLTIGVCVGVMLGFLLGLSDVVMRAFRPLINFFHAIVDMAWIPLFVLWFGYGEKTILMSLAYASAFPVLFNFLLGVQSTPKTMVQATQTLGATRIDLIRHVFLPNAIPNLIVGFRIGAGFAFRALIAAEVIAGRSGIGFMIFEARESQLIGRTIVGMVLLGALWVAIDRLVLRAIEAATIERWGMVQGRLK